MGNWWKGVSETRLAECELQLFTSNGIPSDAIEIRNVRLDEGNSGENYVHEISVKGDREGLPTLVMIHGYMSGGGQFFKMVKHLRPYFDIVMIDLLGLGRSGRPTELKLDGFECSLNFYLDSIHRWTMVSELGQNGDKFHLLGHSLGGMIAGHYAIKYPHQIEKLTLMSSVGVSERPQNLQDENFVANRQSVAARYGASWVQESWSQNLFSPPDLYRTAGYTLAKKMFYTGLYRRIRSDCLTDEEKDLLIEYILQMTMRPKSSEGAVFQLLAPMAFAVNPLCRKLPDLNIPIAFMHGEYDWVTRDCADKMIAEGQIEGEVFTTSMSGHHLYVEAPVECVSCLLKFTYGEQVQNDFICSQ